MGLSRSGKEQFCAAKLPLGGRQESEGAASMLVILHLPLCGE